MTRRTWTPRRKLAVFEAHAGLGEDPHHGELTVPPVGVSRAKHGLKWRAYASSRGRQVNLGVFDTMAEAAKARQDYDVINPKSQSRASWIRTHAQHDGNECLEWPFSTASWYASISTCGGSKWSKAHREMCIAAHGPAPFDGAMALHSCDNKRCVNPRHLKWGDTAQNMKEAIERGLILAGERAAQAKLTELDVLSARQDRRRGMTYEAVAEKYGVTRGAIWHAINGTQWKHLP